MILTYHSISEGQPPLAISPAVFAWQMEWLSANARVVPLGEIVEALLAGRALPERGVALTFDDGYRDFHANAFPVLARFQFPATVFLPTDFCGRTNDWPGLPASVSALPLMDWTEIRELAGAGIEFGSHSASHPYLDKVSSEGLEREIAGSKQIIRDQIGRAPDFFCYPYGVWTPAVRESVRQHYRGACSTGAGIVEPRSDPFALPRVDAHYVRDAAWFERLFTGFFRTYLATRRLVRRLRGKPEGFVSRV